MADRSGITWTQRPDSIARRRTPEDFVAHDEPTVIAALFTERGAIVGHTAPREARELARTAVSGPQRIESHDYLRSVFPETGHTGLLRADMAIMPDAPQAVLVTGIVPGR